MLMKAWLRAGVLAAGAEWGGGSSWLAWRWAVVNGRRAQATGNAGRDAGLLTANWKLWHWLMPHPFSTRWQRLWPLLPVVLVSQAACIAQHLHEGEEPACSLGWTLSSAQFNFIQCHCTA